MKLRLKCRAKRRDTGWLKGWGGVDTLGGGEVAERLNAAVSKTVTSVIPASGVRIPPSPPLEAGQPVSFPSGDDVHSRERNSVWDRVRSARWSLSPPAGSLKC